MSQLKFTQKRKKLKIHKLMSASKLKPPINSRSVVPKSSTSTLSSVPKKVEKPPCPPLAFYNAGFALPPALSAPKKLSYAEALRQNISTEGLCKKVEVSNNSTIVPSSTEIPARRSDSNKNVMKPPPVLNKDKANKQRPKCQAPVQRNNASQNVQKLIRHQPSAFSTERKDIPKRDSNNRAKGPTNSNQMRKHKGKSSAPSNINCHLKQDATSKSLSPEVYVVKEAEKSFVDCVVAEPQLVESVVPVQLPAAEYNFQNVEPANTLQDVLGVSPYLKDSWLHACQSKWQSRRETRREELNDVLRDVEKLAAERCSAEHDLVELFKSIQLVDTDMVVFDDFPELFTEKEEIELPLLSLRQEAKIEAAICGPPDQILIAKYNLNITRRDIKTLIADNWLNDEVINFYMNLLVDRSEQKHVSHGLPRVYAMNTFFLPRLLQSGYDGVRRWTRKVDIFSKDLIPVPVHVSGIHWCMAIINLTEHSIKYYDSMSRPNTSVLVALKQYLSEESLDKRQQPLDTSQFVMESVRNMPLQLNSSDCGVFSCMVAEFVTRNKAITFSQQDMSYFRRKMILEITGGELLA